MKCYQFNDENKSISIKKVDLPAPWINYLSNGHLHAFVSQAAGGFTWVENGALGRITRYRSHNLPIDSPGFYVYIKDEDGTIWSPSFRPAETPLDSFEAIHQPGKTSFVGEKNGVKATLTLFITLDYDVLAWKLDIENKTGVDKKLDVFAYVELSQLNWLKENESGHYWRHMLKTWFDKDSQSVQYLFHFPTTIPTDEMPLVYFASDRKVESFSGDRDAFVGNYRYERNPIAVENGVCGNEEISSGEPCAAIHNKITVASGKKERVQFYLGTEAGGLTDIEGTKATVKSNLDALRAEGAVDAAETKLDAWWDEFLAKFQCEIPDKVAQRQINIWGAVESLHTARYNRSISITAPGYRSLGFRDTTQDMLAMTYRLPEWALDRFEYVLAHQFKGGNTLHNMGTHDRQNEMKSDNPMWPSFLAYSLIAETGDADFLWDHVPFLAEDGWSAGEDATVWDHLLASVKFTESHLGEHGLPLTLTGDWNDIIGKFSRKGKGESVFAAQQFVVSLNYMIEIAEFVGKTEEAEYFKDCKSRMATNILKHAWNGKWWYRCFNDEGQPLGSEKDEFGKIWINSQTWALLSGVGSYEQQRAGLDAVNKYLDTGTGLQKLSPGFETYPYIKDPFSGYNPGNGENGAVFCHAHTWAVVAEAIIGNSTLAWKYYTDLLADNIIGKIGVERYKAEPYAWCSNIVGHPNNKQGWGNVTHITGATPWMNIAASQYLLGVRPVLSGVLFDPCVPADWDGFTVKREFRGIMLNITYKNPDHKEKGASSIELLGKKIDGNLLPYDMIKDQKSVDIVVTM